MSYAILRTAKLKSMGEIGGSLAHTFRTRETPNADPERGHLNEFGAGDTPESIKAALAARLPEKRRSDAVLCVEYFIGASPEHFANGQDGAAYFADAVAWLKAKHGAENVVATAVHRDETSPHLVAYVVPLDDQGKLNAKAFLGGKAKLSAMQTDFATQVGQKHGLERGIEGSKATHQSIKQYYAVLEQGTRELATVSPKSLEPRVLEKANLLSKAIGRGDLVESPDMIAERLTKAVNKHFAGTVAKASESAQNARRAKAAEETAKDLRKRLELLEAAYKGLTKAQVREVIKVAMTFQMENAKAKEREQAQSKDQDKGRSR